MLDVKEIWKAWKIAENPTPAQSELAKKRFDVCISCPHKSDFEIVGKLISSVCGKCGCPLNKKIFAEKPKMWCPIGKWDSIK
jgi:hypothetical protein